MRKLLDSGSDLASVMSGMKMNSKYAPKPKTRKAVEVFIDPDKDDVNKRGAEVLREIVSRESAEDRLINEAYQYLNDRYATMAEAGLPSSMAAKMDGMGAITSKVPQEVRVITAPNVETRYSTRYGEVNPITGQKDINPYIDPVTNTALVTNLGRGVRPEMMDGYEKASEYVQQQLGRLAGMRLISNNVENVHDVDFIDRGMRIDGETTRPSWRNDGDAVQAYTKVIDSNNPNQRAELMAPSIKKMMEGIIKKNPDANIMDVIKIAGNRLDGGRYNRDPLPGKVLDESKDAILLTVLSDKNHQLNSRRNMNDTVPVPVQGALLQDLKGVRNIISDIKGEELSKGLQVRPNNGPRGDGEPRGRVYVTPNPEDIKRTTIDLAAREPRIRQLFDYKQ